MVDYGTLGGLAKEGTEIMKRWCMRVRYYGLSLAASGLFVLGGCALTDQQLAQVWQAVITSGLNTLVTNVITAAVPTTTG